jgi:hypothetical protein
MSGTQPVVKAESALEKPTWSRAVIPGLLVAAPAVLFYGILFRTLVNLPLLDDYDAVLGFLNQLVKVTGTGPRLRYFMSAQHNEYKIFFGHGVAWAQYALIGHVNFAAICVLGDCAVVALALVLWSMFLPGEKDLAKRLAYFAPASWLIFQLEYYETLNWAMPSLENLWVIVFSLGAIRCLLLQSVKAYAVAIALYALAVSALGNGFLLLPVGMLMLVRRKQMARAWGWLTFSAIFTAAYAYHYNIYSSQAHEHGSVFATILHIRPDYIIAFIGNMGAVAGASAVSVGLSLTLGTVLLLFFGWLVRRGYFRQNPCVGYCALFLLLTAAGVAGLRSDFGMMQSLSSRYTIYGALLLIFAWSAVVEVFPRIWKEPLVNNQLYVAAMTAAILLGLCMDEMGYLQLERRRREATQGMAAYENSVSPRSINGPGLNLGRSSAIIDSLRRRAPVVLDESIRLGVYEPPRY